MVTLLGKEQHFDPSINGVEDLEKQAAAACRIPVLQLNLRNGSST